MSGCRPKDLQTHSEVLMEPVSPLLWSSLFPPHRWDPQASIANGTRCGHLMQAEQSLSSGDLDLRGSGSPRWVLAAGPGRSGSPGTEQVILGQAWQSLCRKRDQTGEGWNVGTAEGEAETERTSRREALLWQGQPAGDTDIVELVPGGQSWERWHSRKSALRLPALSMPLSDSIPCDRNGWRRLIRRCEFVIVV